MRRLRARYVSVGSLSDVQVQSIKVLSILLCLFLFFLAIRALFRLFFFGGTVFGIEVPEIKIERVVVSAGEAVGAQRLREYLDIREGNPFLDAKEGLFANDLRKKQEKILKATPAIATLSVSRSAPGVVEITSTERTPVARFCGDNSVIDKEGIVFMRYKGNGQYPLITGYALNDDLKPGHVASSSRMVRAAIELVTYLDSGNSGGLKGSFQEIDVSKHDILVCRLTGHRTLKIAWPDMGRGTKKGQDWLAAQLNGFAEAIKNKRSEGLSVFDLTAPCHLYGSQAR